MEVSEEVLEAVTRHPGLRKMGMRCSKLSSMDPGLLARMVKKLEELEMWNRQVTGQQLEAVMTALCEGDSGLKKLTIADNDLSSVDAGLLASAVKTLEGVEMYYTHLTVEQGTAIFTAINQENCNMKKLDISENNLSSVDTGLLARSVNMLEEVVMNRTELTVKQMEAILTQSLVKTSLRRLEMNMGDDWDDLEIDRELVARARLVIEVICV